MSSIQVKKPADETKGPEKPGFLGLDFKVGEGLPKEIWPHKIPVHIGEKGELEWKFRPMEEVIREQIDAFSDQQRQKMNDLLQMMLRSFRSFTMALFFGQPVKRQFASSFFSHPLQSPPISPKMLKQESWGVVPVEIQEHLLKSAFHYRYPDAVFNEDGTISIPQEVAS